jgi:hypothetical protein
VIDAGPGAPAKPPLVIRSTFRMVAGGLLLLLAVAVGAAYSEAPRGSKGSPLVSAVVGLACAALAVRVGAARVRASTEGLDVRNTWRSRRIPWASVVEVQVVALSGRLGRARLPRPGAGVTVHLRDGDEVLLRATVRHHWRDRGRDTYGPPFDRWLAGLEAFRRPWSARWN